MSIKISLYQEELDSLMATRIKSFKQHKVKEQLFLDALHLTVDLSVHYLCMDLSLVCNWWIHALFEHLSDLQVH